MKKIALAKFGSDVKFTKTILDAYAERKNIHFFYYDNNDLENFDKFSRCDGGAFSTISLVDLGEYFVDFPAENLFSPWDIKRDDPDLIYVIKKFGLSDNKIVEIPDDVDWEIQSCEASEWIAEKHRTWS